jgi:predicted butyrate kinase (DUF1464 family)
MIRVAGTDPGTSSLDLLLLEDGVVRDQCRFEPQQIQTDPALPVRWLVDRGPYDLIAGPCGYGLPLVRAQDCSDLALALMTLVRPDEPAPTRRGVLGFRGMIEALRASSLPVVFLPGAIHLPTVPAHRKTNRIDLGTPDKLCVAALAIDRQGLGGDVSRCNLCVVEFGTAFTAALVVAGGRIVDACGGTSGPYGWRSGGCWDGELAYLLSPLGKRDLFAGGVLSHPRIEEAKTCFREALVKSVAGLKAVTPFQKIIVSGRLLEYEPQFADLVTSDLGRLGEVVRLDALPDAWVKHAAQGAALLADGLAGGGHSTLVETLDLRKASGTSLDWLHHPRASEIRRAFGVLEPG